MERIICLYAWSNDWFSEDIDTIYDQYEDEWLDDDWCDPLDTEDLLWALI